MFDAILWLRLAPPTVTAPRERWSYFALCVLGDHVFMSS